MKPCEVCGSRNRCQTKQYKKNGGCDLFWLNPKEYKKVKNEDNETRQLV